MSAKLGILDEYRMSKEHGTEGVDKLKTIEKMVIYSVSQAHKLVMCLS
jgi:hypothetical protein